MREIITDDVGEIKLGKVVIPGIFKSMDISGAVRVDEENVLGRSGKSRQPLGFEDAIINLTLDLPTNDLGTCYDRLAVVVELFQKVDSHAKPYIYRIVNKITSIWGIKDVVFSDLRMSDYNSRKDTLEISLTFKEYRPTLVKKEARVTSKNLNPYTDFASYQQTVSIATDTKTGTETPAKDVDEP